MAGQQTHGKWVKPSGPLLWGGIWDCESYYIEFYRHNISVSSCGSGEARFLLVVYRAAWTSELYMRNDGLVEALPLVSHMIFQEVPSEDVVTFKLRNDLS